MESAEYSAAVAAASLKVTFLGPKSNWAWLPRVTTHGPEASAGYAGSTGPGPRDHPYPAVTPLSIGPPAHAGGPSPPPPGLESTSPHPPSSKERAPREGARQDKKSASKTPPPSAARHSQIEDKLQANAMSAFGLSGGAPSATVPRIVADDEDDMDQMLDAAAPGAVHARPPDEADLL
ncbi:hypothetical protein AK812_SmicGene32238 [Symbiodinium microadriaticum]|uniref:Uncharacterized protein n=1 Tax=Symbiodinium microadriaticum TaxID=2951 RepID=A0A1Q9CUN1_SYMMI|nr:hypothetical protein AK812_SmicGene32238 [Symbiodinium microadriaticum]